MRTGLPRFSPLNVIELRIYGPLIEWGYSIAYLLEYFSNTDYFLAHRRLYKFRSLEEQDQAPLVYNNLKGLDLDEPFKSFFEKYSTKLSKLSSSLENVRMRNHCRIEFDGLFDDCTNLKKFSVPISDFYLARPLPDTIEVLEFSFDDRRKAELATEYFLIDNVNRLSIPADGLKYLEPVKCLNLKDLVVRCAYCPPIKKNYVREGEILERVLTISDVRRLEFQRDMKSLASGVVKAGTIFSRLKSLMFADCRFEFWKLTDLCDFVSRCPNLRFLLVDFDDISDNFTVIKTAVDNCPELSEIYLGNGQERILNWASDDRQGEEFVEYMEELRANFTVFISKYGVFTDEIDIYDPYGDVTLEGEYYQLDVHMVRTFGQNEWNEMIRTIEYIEY